MARPKNSSLLPALLLAVVAACSDSPAAPIVDIEVAVSEEPDCCPGSIGVDCDTVCDDAVVNDEGYLDSVNVAENSAPGCPNNQATACGNYDLSVASTPGQIVCDPGDEEDCAKSICCMFEGNCHMVESEKLAAFPKILPRARYMRSPYCSISGSQAVVEICEGGSKSCRPTSQADCDIAKEYVQYYPIFFKDPGYEICTPPGPGCRGFVYRHYACCAVLTVDGKPMPDDECW